MYKIEDFKKLSKLKKDYLLGKSVFVRVDFNLPFDENNKITNEYRIKRTLPTLKHLLDNKCSVVIATHIGKPEERRISSQNIVETLQKYLDEEVNYVNDYSGVAATNAIRYLNKGELLLLENVRFYEQELEENGDQMARVYSDLFDYYINDAFAVSHRASTSTTVLPKYLDSYIGLNLESEIINLSKAAKPTSPSVLIIGGAKLESKLPVIESFLPKADTILVGGKLVNEAREQKLDKNKNVVIANLTDDGLDIDFESVEVFKKYINNANSITWAGPLGLFEKEPSEYGTKEICSAIANSSAFKVIGGGDTVTAAEKFSNLDKFDFVSTGGGAMLKFLSGENLPALDVLI